ncbi:ABC transporter permease [Geothrix sp. PMB-07]|uniref:ABC transporter permease n=1 Tax=Geothrix sp. PMB-07 TaxID=3068640 RepID=UPI002740AE05|nr:ABC transporter permease [Geothrix sp. PMB-07]WLT31879.1 ABC transporter permease [Geothrix sp. PMB-07]
MIPGAFQALRSLLRRPWFFAGTVTLLALGMGAALALFTLFDALRIRPLPVAEPDRLVLLSVEPPPRMDFPKGMTPPTATLVSWPLFERHRQENPVFQGLAYFQGREVFLGHGAEGGHQVAGFASGDYLRTLGLKPTLGRFFADAETWDAEPKVVLSHALWISRHGADPGVIGREVLVDGQPCVVVGIAPRGFFGLLPKRPEALWITLGALIRYDQPDEPGFRISEHPTFEFNAVGRLQPGLSVAQAQRQSQTVTRRHPGIPAMARTLLSPLTRSQDMSLDAYLPSPGLLFAAVGLCLLLACLVVANLQLAHQEHQRRESSTRVALGASAWQLARGMFMEHLWLTGLGAALGWGFARLALPSLLAFDGRSPFAMLEIPILRASSVGFALGLALLLAALTTALPLLRALRQAPMEALKESAPTAGRRKLQAALVVAQVALCLSLLGPVASVVQSLQRVLSMRLGVGRENVEVHVTLPPERMAQAPALLTRLLEEARHLPGATGAAMGGDTGAGSMGPSGVAQMGAVATEDYFQVRNRVLVAGRGFLPSDGPQQIIISEAIARANFPGRSALGQALDGREVVGVEKDGPLPVDLPMGYLYTRMQPAQMAGQPLFIRASSKAEALLPAVRDLVQRVLPDAADLRVETHAQALAREAAAPLMAISLLGFLGGLSLILALLGISSMLAFTTAQRRREVGIRMAMGARPTAIVGQFLRQGGALVVGGFIVGALGAWAIHRLMDHLFFALPASRAYDQALGASLLLLASLIACLIPALRASRTVPAEALRTE